MVDNVRVQNSVPTRWSVLACAVALSLLLTACLFATPAPTYTIGVVNLSPLQDGTLEGFKEGMAELGYVEGENITYLYEGATDDIGALDGIAQGLVEADVDLILSITTPATQAAQRATADNDIPIVFIPVTDPVGAGLVEIDKEQAGAFDAAAVDIPVQRIGFVNDTGRMIVKNDETVLIDENLDDLKAAWKGTLAL